MTRRCTTLVLAGLLTGSVPVAAHFVVTAPTEGATVAPGAPIAVHIDVTVHHDPGETFDILLVDERGSTTELAAGLDDTAFPYTVTLPEVDTPGATLRMIQHGPYGYQYEQSVGVHVATTGDAD